MAKIKYDLAVKTGEYQDGDGNTKGRYENIGKVIQGDDGFYMILKRTFNPAGVPNPQDRDSVLVSMFEPRERDQAPQRSSPSERAQAPASGGGFADDVVF